MGDARVGLDLNWDHNAWYHRRLLREVPDHAGRVLDVGCGAGTLATRLAARADHVDAIDLAPHMVELAEARVPSNVTVRVADVVTDPLPPDHYDAVVSLSVLHHLDLATVLPRLAATLRPDGVLAAIALPRVDLPRDLPVELVSAVGHRVLGASFRLEQLATGRRRFAHEPSLAVMPVRDAELTASQVRAAARGVLPGVTVRRLPFWRYLLVWRRPA